MSDIRSEDQEEEIVVAARPSVGERLRAAREARGLTTGDMASALKLSPRQVEALEAGDWSGLPGNTFIRGFVRNYARALQLDAEALLVDLEAPVPQPPRLDLPQNASAVMPQVGQAQRRDYAVVLAGLVVVAIAIVAYFVVPPDFWQSTQSHGEVPADTAAPVSLNPPVTTVVPAGDAPPSSPVVATDNAGAGATPSPADIAAQAPAVPVASVPPPAEVVAPAAAPVTAASPATVVAAASAQALRFRFAQPSWVEVRDRSGQIVHSELNAAGSEIVVEGAAPYTLVVGNASHVSLSYKGRNVELQPRSRDDVARLIVE